MPIPWQRHRATTRCVGYVAIAMALCMQRACDPMSAYAANVHWSHAATHMHTQVRERVHSLLRLAEMKWRYRVVEKGQSPRDEGLKLLYMAKQVLRSSESVISEECSSSACWSYTLGT